jgi:TnpA family transposase
VLDEILGNATDLPITEHATDTHGVTLVNFGLFDLLGCSSRRASATWAASPCTVRARAPRRNRGFHTRDRC